MSTRLSADERRAQVVDIALRHFARGGYHGTSTEAIASEAGVSQPYLFRLFGTKRELFVACARRACGRVGDTFERAATSAPDGEELHAMGRAYADLVADEHLLRFMLQMYAATTDAEIRAEVRKGYGELVDRVRALSAASEEEIWAFFARGMLLNVLVSLELEV